jgi:hypothetical protein
MSCMPWHGGPLYLTFWWSAVEVLLLYNRQTIAQLWLPLHAASRRCLKLARCGVMWCSYPIGVCFVVIASIVEMLVTVMFKGRIWTASNPCSIGCRLCLAQTTEGSTRQPVAMGMPVSIRFAEKRCGVEKRTVAAAGTLQA